MASRKVFSLKEINSIINADDFFDSDDEENDNTPILLKFLNFVEIPPERVDELPDNEDIDADILDDEEPSDVPGMIEIHRSATKDRVVVLDPSSNIGATASAAANSTVSPPTEFEGEMEETTSLLF